VQLGVQQDLLNYSAPFRKFHNSLLFADYERPLPDQHPYGSGNDLEIHGAMLKRNNQHLDRHLLVGIQKRIDSQGGFKNKTAIQGAQVSFRFSRSEVFRRSINFLALGVKVTRGKC